MEWGRLTGLPACAVRRASIDEWLAASSVSILTISVFIQPSPDVAHEIGNQSLEIDEAIGRLAVTDMPVAPLPCPLS